MLPPATALQKQAVLATSGSLTIEKTERASRARRRRAGFRKKAGPSSFPTNLRNPKALKYKRDEAISKIIINGIPGTSMIAMGPPDGILTLEQIDLLLIYLKEIRNAVYFR